MPTRSPRFGSTLRDADGYKTHSILPPYHFLQRPSFARALVCQPCAFTLCVPIACRAASKYKSKLSGVRHTFLYFHLHLLSTHPILRIKKDSTLMRWPLAIEATCLLPAATLLAPAMSSAVLVAASCHAKHQARCAPPKTTRVMSTFPRTAYHPVLSP